MKSPVGANNEVFGFVCIEILHDCCISWQIYVSFLLSSDPPPNRAGAPFLEKPHNFVRIAGRYCWATTTDSTSLKQTKTTPWNH